jgi:hypothetical protein
MALFKLCTSITVGNGTKTSFWKDRWLQGQAPKDIAPVCFKLAWRKNQIVAVAMADQKWMRGLRRISTAVGIQEFVELWTRLSQVQLSQQPDTISWRFTTNGKYSAQSAYNVQFIGTITNERWKSIWKAKVQNKCRFFTWLAVQLKLPTTDRIIKQGRQVNPICALCRTTDESHIHMFAKCTYTRAVWQSIAQWSNLQLPPQNVASMCRWWHTVTQGVRGMVMNTW